MAEAGSQREEMIAIRRELHRHPEMGRKETRTQALILDHLKALGLMPRPAADTGVVVDLPGSGPGPIVALRADIDALPIQEATGLPFASEVPGFMHACGHDLHIAALLGAAKLLSRPGQDYPGTVRLLFQPDEEGDGGAARMVAEGAMEGVACVYGCHVAPELPAGRVAFCSGKAYAASNPFDITVYGESAHGAEPENGRDALFAACEIVQALQSIVSREIAPLESAVITVGSLHAGTARNILAGEARLSGILRCFGEEARHKLTARIDAIAALTAQAHGVRAETAIQWGYAGVVNDPAETAFARGVAERLLGTERVEDYPPSLTTEDFGAFLQCVPGSYWHLGVGRPDAVNPPLHNPCFDPDEGALPIAAALHAQLAMAALREHIPQRDSY